MRKEKSITRVLSMKHIALVTLALLCGFAAAIVDAIRIHGHMVFSFRCMWFTGAIALLFLAFVFIGERFLAWCSKDGDRTAERMASVRDCFSFSWGHKQFFLTTAVIVLCWIPYIWLTYPGILWFDTGEQLNAMVPSVEYFFPMVVFGPTIILYLTLYFWCIRPTRQGAWISRFRFYSYALSFWHWRLLFRWRRSSCIAGILAQAGVVALRS